MKPAAKTIADRTSFRLAAKTDATSILDLVRELAEYEKRADEAIATEEDLMRGLFGSRPYAECMLAERDGQIVGYALFFHNFSTFTGKPGIFLEDLYVKSQYRGGGIGMQFFRELARIALERNCGRMEWSVLNWNESALKFYQKLGAASQEDWILQRLTRVGIEALAKN